MRNRAHQHGDIQRTSHLPDERLGDAHGVDSDEGEDDFTPFRNIMNEWYAKDISKKRRIVNKMKGKRAATVSAPRPFQNAPAAAPRRNM